MAKTVFEPTTRIELLGFIIDTEAWLYGLPERRLRKLEGTASGLLHMLEEDRLGALADEGPDAAVDRRGSPPRWIVRRFRRSPPGQERLRPWLHHAPHRRVWTSGS